MIKKTYIAENVVTMARRRIKNIFNSSPRISLSLSGGKDSAVLATLIYDMCKSGEIDKSKLTVEFVDEEAIYPCIERCVKHWRQKFLSIGVKFNWWCIPVRHFSCFNQLQQDESFILWDPNKKDVWIREMPPFAITDHSLLRKYQDTYQSFFDRSLVNSIKIIGVRLSESVQRQIYFSKLVIEDKQYPIYDWTDNDVWLFIRNNNVEIPEAYMYMFQVGMSRKEMRISQFFSVDTAKSLVKMCEFYPNLFERICKREPNAYMAMLYFDTELFRRHKKEACVKSDEVIDWRKKVFDYLNDDGNFDTLSKKKLRHRIRSFIFKFSFNINDNLYKKIYNMMVGGDPKMRTFRALFINVARYIKDKYYEECKND